MSDEKKNNTLIILEQWKRELKQPEGFDKNQQKIKKFVEDSLIKYKKSVVEFIFCALLTPDLFIKWMFDEAYERAQQESKYNAERVKQLSDNYTKLVELHDKKLIDLTSITNIDEIDKYASDLTRITTKQYKLLDMVFAQQESAENLAIREKASKQKIGSSDQYKEWIYSEIKKLQLSGEGLYGKYTYNNKLNKSMFSKIYKKKLKKHFGIDRTEKTIRGWLDEYLKRLP